MINWPAVLHYRGDNELVFIAGQSQWDNDAELYHGNYDPDDRLIDSLGLVFKPLVTPLVQAPQLAPTGQSVALEALVELIRLHMSEVGLCCVAKFSAGSIEEAVVMVSTFAEE